MEKDSGHKLAELAVDGGMSNSELCMQVCYLHFVNICVPWLTMCQTQADITGITVERPKMRETTALGAAVAAGFAVDVWKTFDDLKGINQEGRTDFKPKISEEARNKMYKKWTKAVEMSKGWTDPDEEINYS